MNLFARILSHGFALVLVALLAIGLIYKGDLFPGMELPEFLALDRKQETADEPAADVTAEPDAMPSAADLADADTGVTKAPATIEPGAVAGPGTVERGEDVPAPADTEAVDALPVPGETPVPAEIADATTAAETTVDTAADEITSAAVDAVPAAPVDIPAEAPVAEPPVIPAPDEAPVSAAAEAAADTMVTEGQPVAGADVEAAAPVAIPGEAETPAAAPAEAAPEMAETTTAAVADAPPAKSAYQLLAAAREAYWLRDYVAAEQNYRAMIDLDPDNPDGYGELGNMYFSQGKWDLASTAYFEAGKRLADEGQYDQARQLVDVLRGLQGPQAGELEQYIADRTSTNQ